MMMMMMIIIIIIMIMSQLLSSYKVQRSTKVLTPTGIHRLAVRVTNLVLLRRVLSQRTQMVVATVDRRTAPP